MASREDRWTGRLAEMTELLDVKDKLNVSVRELSLGERMKMELIASLLHKPRVLFLDEPTIGLDVVSQKTVREFLREYNAREQTTILLTSHYMADIQQLCRRVIIIDHGAIFFDGKLSEIIDRFADFKLITIQCAGADKYPAENLLRYGEVVERTSGSLKLKVKRDRVIPACKALLDELPVSDIDIEEVPIEDVIRQIFARKWRKIRRNKEVCNWRRVLQGTVADSTDRPDDPAGRPCFKCLATQFPGKYRPNGYWSWMTSPRWPTPSAWCW